MSNLIDEIEPDVIFTVKNRKTGKKVVINSSKNFDELNNILDNVSSAKMLAKAEIETNPTRKRMMLLYAKRKAEIEAMEANRQNKLMIRYEMIGAYNENEMRHPQEVITELSRTLKFTVTKYYPVSIADCWLVWLESESVLNKESFPKYVHVFDDYESFDEWNRPDR